MDHMKHEVVSGWSIINHTANVLLQACNIALFEARKIYQKLCLKKNEKLQDFI